MRARRRRRSRSTATGSPRFEADATATLRVDATRLRRAAGVRRLPHAPAVRRLARGRVRDEGHRRPVRGDRARAAAGSRRRRARSRAAPTTRRARAGARPRGRDAARPARRRSRARPATACRYDAERRAARLGRALGERGRADDGGHRPVRPRRAGGLHRRRVDGRGRSALADTADVDALDIYVETVAFANEHLERLGAIAARPRAAAARARRAVRGEPLGAGRARRRRALGRPPRVPAPRRPRPARGERDRRRAPPRRGVPRRRGASRRPAPSPTRARSACSGPTSTPARRRWRRSRRSSALRCAATGGRSREALLACTLNAAYVLGMAGEVGSLEAGKRADVILLDTPDRARARTASPATRCAPCSSPAARCGCARTARGGLEGGVDDAASSYVPAMVNAHSHAFQRDLRGVAERPGAPGRRLLVVANGDVPPRGRARARHDARRRGARVRRDGRGRATAPSASSTTSTTARTARRTRPQRDGDRGRRGGASRPACGSSCSPPPTTATAGTARDRPPEPGQRRFCDPDVETFLAPRRRRCAPGPRTATASTVGLAAHSVRAVPAAWLEAIAAHAREHDLVLHVHAHEQRRELARVRRRARLHADRAARPHRLPRRAHERHPRHPRDRRATSTSSPGRARSSCRARRPRATSATASSPRCATATRACGWRSAATRRSASTRSRRSASSRPARGARARPATRCSPRRATCGASSSPTAARRSASTDAGHGRGRPRPPRPARGRRGGPAVRAGDVRVRRRRRARRVESAPPMSPADRLAARALELIDVPSESRDEADLAAHVLDVLRDGDVDARDAGDTCVLAGATERGERPLVLLAGHLDTVPAQDNRPGRREGGTVHGLGAADMKGADAVMVELALGASRRAGERRRRLRLLRPRGAAVRRQRADAAARARARPARPPTPSSSWSPRRTRSTPAAWATSTRRGRSRARSGHSARPWFADNAIHRAAAGIDALAQVPVRAARVRRAALHPGRLGHADRGRDRRQRDPRPRRPRT